MHFAAQAANEKGWKYNSKRIKWAAQEFRNLQQPLTAEMLRKVFMVDDHPQIHYKECSCVAPDVYRDRFLKFITRIF